MKARTEYSNWKINLELYCFQDGEGNELYVQPRLIKLLKVLTDNTNRVVTREELVSQIWNDVLVGEESLSKAVFDLRQFLKDNFFNAPEIATIRKVGYRLQKKKETNSKRNSVIRSFKRIAYVVILVTIAVLVIRGLMVSYY